MDTLRTTGTPQQSAEENQFPKPVDVHVGSRILLRRNNLGMSQAKLAEALGLTFQQIQKYERGTNRVSASRLVDIAQALDVPIGFFFDDLPGNKIFGACSDCVTVIEGANGNGAPRQETQTLLRAYYSISDLNIRKRMLALVKSLAAGCGPIPASRDEARLRSLIGELGDRPVPERGGPGPSGVTIEPE